MFKDIHKHVEFPRDILTCWRDCDCFLQNIKASSSVTLHFHWGHIYYCWPIAIRVMLYTQFHVVMQLRH